jgi:hypothetical protein
MTEHELKCWPEPFKDVLDGVKLCEVRKNDRDFKVGDVLLLREWRRERDTHLGGDFTGQRVRMRITHVVAGGLFGLPADMCVLSISPAPEGRSADVCEAVRKAVIKGKRVGVQIKNVHQPKRSAS